MNILTDLVFKKSKLIMHNNESLSSRPQVGEVAFLNGIYHIYSVIDDNPMWFPLASKKSYFSHNQDNASGIWTINHNLGTSNIIVNIFDNTGKLINVTPTVVSDNQVIVELPSSVSGKAIVFGDTSSTLNISGYYNKEEVDLIKESLETAIDVSLKNFKINGKSFDENNNIDLEGLSTLSNSKLNEEVLTENRHPISGKPIYTKTINFGFLPNATNKFLAHGIADVEDIKVDTKESYAYYLHEQYPIVWTDTVATAQWRAWTDRTDVGMKTGFNATSIAAYITLLYTKITDTAESPVRLIGGEPKSNYDLWLEDGNTGTLSDFIEATRGLKGAEGAEGAEGKSAYEVYTETTKDSPIKTKEQWLDSLVIGKDGKDGIDGIDGNNNYTIKEVNGREGDSYIYNFKSKQFAFRQHCYALREYAANPTKYTLQTTLLENGFYGVKIPKLNEMRILTPKTTGGTTKYLIENGGVFYKTVNDIFNLAYKHMTSNSSQGQVASASSEYNTTYQAWNAFKPGMPANANDCWASVTGATAASPQHLEIDLGVSKRITGYKIINRSDGSVAAAKSWIIEGRNDKSETFKTLHEVKNNTNNSGKEASEFHLNSSHFDYYRYIRIKVTEGHFTSFVCISRFVIYSILAERDLELLENISSNEDVLANGTNINSFIEKSTIENLSEAYIITPKEATVVVEIDAGRTFEFVNNITIRLTEDDVTFTLPSGGVYKLCYQDP